MFTLALLFVSSCLWAQSPAHIATIAKVSDQIITTRDLQINQFLNEIENPLQPFVDKKDPVREITWEFLIYKEAQELMNDSVSKSEVQAYVKQFKKKVVSDDLWKSLQVGDSALTANAERKLTVKKFLAVKMPESLVSVDEESVESYYVTHKVQLGNRPLTEVREKIIKGLKQQKMQERFRDWINATTRNYGVVYYSGVKIQ